MSIIQFARILRARFWIILAATVSCVAGGLIVTLIVPPRWEAHSRVLLNLLRPDPVTGEVIASAGTRAYIATQTELIRDYGVAGAVVDQLGWLSEPELIRLYRERSPSDIRDFRRWLADLIIERTRANVVLGSNILEITYTSDSPETSRAVADTLRKAYIEASLAFRTGEATRNAEWFSGQADTARAALEEALAAKTAYERKNGIILPDEEADVDTALLRALASEKAARSIPVISPPSSTDATPSAASIQLAQIDAEIAEALQTLGPNHPEVQGLRARRAAMESSITAARPIPTSLPPEPVLGDALDRAVAAQKSLVIANRDKLGPLMQLQAEVDLRRDLFIKTAARAADLRQEAAVADTGLTALGSAVAPEAPVFPNKPLIFFGSLGLGLATGGLVALLVELLNRRVRGVEDLQSLVEVPVLAVVSEPAMTIAHKARQRSRLMRMLRGRKMLQA